MTIVHFFQSINSPFFSFLASFFNFFASFPFFVVVFAIIFLFFSKDDAYKFSIFGFVNFVFGALLLKNIIGRPRPYQADTSLFADRSYFTKSLPSVSSMNFAGVLLYPFAKSAEYKSNQKLKTNTSSLILPSYLKTAKREDFAKKMIIVIFAGLLFLLVGLSKIYFAENYFSDIILGGALGIGTYFLVFKFIKNVESPYFLLLLIAPITIVFLYFNQWFSAGYTLLFEGCGFFSAVVLGNFFERKIVKMEIRNNLFFSFFKGLLLIIFLLLCYFLNIFLLSGAGLLSFLSYFLAGLGVTFLLPFIFKTCQQYFFIFAENITNSNLVFSKISLSLNSTKKIASKISSILQKGDIVLLEGDLGAGKSVIVREILRKFGVKGKITSPTFTIVNEYFSEKKHFHHFDLYRIEDEEELKNLGFEDILNDKDSVKFVEWPSKISHLLPKNYFKISIVKLTKNIRNIILEEKK